MSYTVTDFKTKAALRRAVMAQFTTDAAHDVSFKADPGLRLMRTSIVGDEPTDGRAFLEGPHSPKPHTWYAKVYVEGGVVTRLLS